VPSIGWWAGAVGLAGVLGGCSPLPEVAYETKRLRIAPEFDAPICEGTLRGLDDHLREVEASLGLVGRTEPYLLYWMREGLDDVCGGAGGCFYPATRMMFARGGSITHEMTHAALDSEGESYFLEEGMAELLSGVGVYYAVDEADMRPSLQLRLSRAEYKAGGIDYAAAGHFMRWVYDARGLAGVRRLAAEVETGAPPDQLERVLAEVMGEGIETVELEYRQKARRAYEGLGYERTDLVTMVAVDEDDELPGPEAFVRDLEVTLDCGSPETMGPLLDEREGMYRVYRLVVPENAGAVLRVEGDPGTWVDVYNPYASARFGVMTDWMRPDPAIDAGALHLRPGEVLEQELRPGVRAVVLAAEGTARRRVSLHVELTAVLPEPGAPPPPPLGKKNR
jgi:hypothetical protein